MYSESVVSVTLVSFVVRFRNARLFINYSQNKFTLFMHGTSDTSNKIKHLLHKTSVRENILYIK